MAHRRCAPAPRGSASRPRRFEGSGSAPMGAPPATRRGPRVDCALVQGFSPGRGRALHFPAATRRLSRGNDVNCRFCGAPVTTTVVDLGVQPLSNAYVRSESADAMEPFFPLHPRVCGACYLVQLPEFQSPEDIFRDYAYLSSMSDSWLEHCRKYAAAMVERFGLGKSNLVVEVASNDGYLLKFFKDRAIPVLGIEPAANVAAIANAAGLPSLARFFGSALASELRAGGTRADLLVGNNVLAHVPDLNDFVQGLATLLAPEGVLTMEFPHLGRLLEETQFDTVYHENFSYFSLGTAERVFAAHG